MQELITYTIKHSMLGSILIAQSKKGICAVHMDDRPSSLLKNFHERFPESCHNDSDKMLNKRADKIVKYIDRSKADLDVPLDIRGTDFQKKVWNALHTISSGKTVSYTDLANRLNQPNAVRAVARACAANELAVIIPCHRIVKKNGKLSGYRWGRERKQQLLQLEEARL
ncbi:methylated-DNA--[protein]-cysteine S-methyltransferase [Candidatus Nitrospira salsa]